MSHCELSACYSRLEGGRFVAGNALVERQWVLTSGRLSATSLLNKVTQKQWIIRAADTSPAAGIPAQSMDLRCSVRHDSVGADALVAELLADGTPQYRAIIYPGASGIELQALWTVPVQAGSPTAADLVAPTGVETTGANKTTALPDRIDRFVINPLHVRVSQVILRDRTDQEETLVQELTWLLQGGQGSLSLAGNVFVIEQTLTGDGLLLVKMAPLPHARPVKSDFDLILDPDGTCHLLGGGQAYPFVVLVYSGGRFGRIAAMQQWQRQHRRYVPARDGLLLSNTWGDRSRDARINEPFMLREIQAGAQLGVDVIQIDDGWQAGRSANSATAGGVWNGFWAANPNFWQPDAERFPAGLSPVVQAASKQNMRLGLWFAPDSSADFLNWEKDAKTIINLHLRQKIDYVKIDGVKAQTTAGEANLRRFFDAVLTATNGNVTFDFDVTAQTRPGYLGLLDVGPVFVENRYTDWHRYWPHRTLRNLWMLAHYIDPVRLRMEFLNPMRNAKLYEGDPLAPSAYSAAQLFAMVMFASPLGWFEISSLSEEFMASAGPLVKLWKQYRQEIHGGTIYPIGREPDGAAWTGFCSVSSDRRLAHVLAFRQLHPAATFRFDAPLDRIPHRVAQLAGDGSITVSEGALTVALKDPLSFTWARLEF